MQVQSPYLNARYRGMQPVAEIDLVSGCLIFSRVGFYDEVPLVWPVETTRVVGSRGFVTFRARYSCARIELDDPPGNPDGVYDFLDLQNDLDDRGGLSGAGTLIVDENDTPIPAGDPRLNGDAQVDVEFIITQDPSPDPGLDPSHAIDMIFNANYFRYNGVRLNPGLPIYTDFDTTEAVTRCLVLDKIVVRPHDPRSPSCGGPFGP